MPKLSLVIGNKNYSSWSLRPWLLMRHFGIAFDEERVSLFTEGFKARIERHSPAGKVPVLVDGDFAIWDSLAICEYLAEKFPEKNVWPQDARHRARARSVAAEMHSGFGALRTHMPMNVRAHLPGRGLRPEVQKDIDRIVQSWADCRAHFADRSAGDFLFSAFSAADAMYAPVCSRFVTYAVNLSEDARRYVLALSALPAMQEWIAAAKQETEIIEEDEPYR
jgi:glutathione S-transferase